MEYWYKTLEGDMQRRFREILAQLYDNEYIVILKGVLSKDQVHIHIRCIKSQNISTIVKKSKGRSLRKL